MEILSPAGNMDLVNSAIKAKSNAVYGGFKLWNARNNAINFSLEEYNLAITKIHKNNMKFYLTLNNLVLDDEIKQIISFLKNPDLILPDAFIVADLGLALELRKAFPNIALHISTQFGAHNLDDIKFLESLKADRIILARELTLKELKNLRKNTSTELECFIWGSQCLSFSGLCLFGSLINGGTGNRGKCINMCRDVYRFYENEGNLLYISDMNAINLVPMLNDIESLKIEGRRRQPKEVENVIQKIKNGEDNTNIAGYLFGEKEEDNNLHYLVNRRIKPICKASELEQIDKYDVFVQKNNSEVVKFCEPKDENAYYVYTEILQDYDEKKYNYSMEIFLSKKDVIEKISITNYKGENTVINNLDEEGICCRFEPENVIKDVENTFINIRIIKIKYLKNKDGKLRISNYLIKELFKYFNSQYNSLKKTNIKHQGTGLIDCLYIQTSNKSLILKYINNSNVKFIYEISSVEELKNIEATIKVLGNKVIYRLPVFNWKSQELYKYYKQLEGLEVMFTRYSQIFVCKNIKFSKKYADYLVYAWNKIAKEKLKQMGIEEFSASPELSYKKNSMIFDKEPVQYFLGGRPSLVYSRNCFKKLFNCDACSKNNKAITNISKNMEFTVLCKNEHREIIFNKPILNNYSSINNENKWKLRYIANMNGEQEIKLLIEGMKSNNLYEYLIKHELWKDAYECNLWEGKE